MRLYIFFILITPLVLVFSSAQNSTRVSIESLETHAGDTVSELSSSLIIVFQSADGTYWFGSDRDGLYAVKGKTIIHYSVKDGLSDDRIRSIQEDKLGNIFISTLGGINKFDGQKFSVLVPEKSSFPESQWKLQDDDLWFGSFGNNSEKGPCRYDGQKLYQLEFSKHFMEEDYYKKYPGNSLNPYSIYSIYKDPQGTVWFGTADLGICRFDGKTLSWLYEDHLTNTPAGGSFGIRSMFEDSHGKYWFCNTRYRFNIFSDSSEGTGNDLIKYSRENGIDGIRSADGTDYIYFMSITEDSTGNLWMATYREGVWKYDGSKLTHYDLKDGDKPITLYSIYKSKNGELWLGTHESGVWKFNGTGFVKFRP